MGFLLIGRNHPPSPSSFAKAMDDRTEDKGIGNHPPSPQATGDKEIRNLEQLNQEEPK
jgi:hypothetical protein